MFRQLAKEYAKREDSPEKQFPLPQSEDGVSLPPDLPPETGNSPTNPIRAFSELFLYHPIQLAGLLEAAWEGRFRPTVDLSRTISPITALPEPLLNALNRVSARPFESLSLAIDPGPPFKLSKKVRFDHMIYAYMIENTRIYEIFHRVLYHFLTGELLQVPSSASQRWLRNTEELFYRDTPPFFAFQLTSYVRPDIRASRRNAYYRMFGMDIDFGTEDGRPYTYEKPAAANRDFVSTLEEFLREVWRGIVNFTNISGPTTTDDQAISNAAQRLSEMLRIRRRSGNLSREEFFFVATMSWFHLTVDFDSPIVADLKAEGANPAERLRKIGDRVGLPAHVKSHDFFTLAEPLSRILLAIESGTFDIPQNVRPLYATGSPLRNDITEIIQAWSSATGRNVKADPVTASPGAMSITAASRAISPAGASPNGSAPVTVPSRT